MKLTSVKYLTKEGVKNAWVNRLMTLASIGVLVACMVIIGLAVLISENVNMAVGNLEKQNVVMAYMKDDIWAFYNADEQTETEDTSSDSNTQEGQEATEDNYVIHNDQEAQALCEEIEKLDNVESVEFVSSEEGLKTVTDSMLEDQKEYFKFDGEYGNPISRAAKVTMKDMGMFEQTVEAIEKMDGIDVVQSQKDLAKTINAIKKGVGVAGFWIIAILMVISLVIVSNTIRVTMYNRKLEISIMKAVGATDAFVRIPFIVEGMLIGVVSAVIAEGLLYFCYRVATETIVGTLGSVVEFGEMAWILFGLFVGIGILAGVIGSVIMISKYLRREGSEFAAI